jgi:hypothetical protein
MAKNSASKPYFTSGQSTLDKAKTLIRSHEASGGINQTAYPDTADPPRPTIGIGFNLNRKDAQALIGPNYDVKQLRIEGHIPDKRINGKQPTMAPGKTVVDQATLIGVFNTTVSQAVDIAKNRVSSFDKLPEAAQLVVIDMAFQLGAGHEWKTRDPDTGDIVVHRDGLLAFQKFIGALNDGRFADAKEDFDAAAYIQKSKDQSKDGEGSDRVKDDEDLLGQAAAAVVSGDAGNAAEATTPAWRGAFSGKTAGNDKSQGGDVPPSDSPNGDSGTDVAWPSLVWVPVPWSPLVPSQVPASDWIHYEPPPLSPLVMGAASKPIVERHTSVASTKPATNANGVAAAKNPPGAVTAVPSSGGSAPPTTTPAANTKPSASGDVGKTRNPPPAVGPPKPPVGSGGGGATPPWSSSATVIVAPPGMQNVSGGNMNPAPVGQPPPSPGASNTGGTATAPPVGGGGGSTGGAGNPNAIGDVVPQPPSPPAASSDKNSQSQNTQDQNAQNNQNQNNQNQSTQNQSTQNQNTPSQSGSPDQSSTGGAPASTGGTTDSSGAGKGGGTSVAPGDSSGGEPQPEVEPGDIGPQIDAWLDYGIANYDQSPAQSGPDSEIQGAGTEGPDAGGGSDSGGDSGNSSPPPSTDADTGYVDPDAPVAGGSPMFAGMLPSVGSVPATGPKPGVVDPSFDGSAGARGNQPIIVSTVLRPPEIYLTGPLPFMATSNAGGSLGPGANTPFTAGPPTPPGRLPTFGGQGFTDYPEGYIPNWIIGLPTLTVGGIGGNPRTTPTFGALGSLGGFGFGGVGQTIQTGAKVIVAPSQVTQAQSSGLKAQKSNVSLTATVGSLFAGTTSPTSTASSKNTKSASLGVVTVSQTRAKTL